MFANRNVWTKSPGGQRHGLIWSSSEGSISKKSWYIAGKLDHPASTDPNFPAYDMQYVLCLWSMDTRVPANFPSGLRNYVASYPRDTNGYPVVPDSRKRRPTVTSDGRILFDFERTETGFGHVEVTYSEKFSFSPIIPPIVYTPFDYHLNDDRQVEEVFVNGVQVQDPTTVSSHLPYTDYHTIYADYGSTPANTNFPQQDPSVTLYNGGVPVLQGYILQYTDLSFFGCRTMNINGVDVLLFSHAYGVTSNPIAATPVPPHKFSLGGGAIPAVYAKMVTV